MKRVVSLLVAGVLALGVAWLSVPQKNGSEEIEVYAVASPSQSYASTPSQSNGTGSSAIAFGSASASATPVAQTKVSATSSGNKGVSSEKVTTHSDGTATVSSVKSSKKSVTIGATVEVDGVAYKVTVLGNGALKNCPKATTVTLPKTLKQINKGAFTGAKNLKAIKLNVTKSITIKSGAFKGVKTDKMTIKVNKKMTDKQLTKFEKQLKSAGYKGKVTRSL